MARKAIGIVAGLITWFVVATIGNLLLRALMPGYAEAEIAMRFTLAMMFARLFLGALSSACSGFAVAWISKGSVRAAMVLGVLLTALFIPVHYGLWDKFPPWYHLLFLASLFLLVVLGALLYARAAVDRRDGTT
jgi:hypothetical protein